MALSVTEGMLRGDAAADDLAADAFDTAQDAALAYAYLAGFLLECLAEAKGESAERCAAGVRRLLAHG
jgi:hypothetical protein